ncbi:MAG: MopE-related protein [Saprospiraceae bacterium]|nr:MopE-related protein [Saprospiraceae bacterium]
MIKHLFILTLISTSFCLNAQSWQHMITNPSTNFFEIQEAFNAEWEGREYQKGFGWKQFKRWENFWKDRVNKDGSFPSKIQFDRAYKQLEQIKSRAENSTRSLDSPWEALGPFNLSNGQGRINVVEVDPTDPNTIYIGAPSGGLWKTTDGGSSWKPLTDHLPTVTASGVAINPQNPQTLLLSTGDFNHWHAYGTGIWRSDDGGETWSQSELVWNPSSGYVRGGKISYHPTDTNIVLCATHSGLYRSSDGGTNWVRVITNDTEDFEFNPGNPDIIYAVSNTTAYKSTDAGASFIPITLQPSAITEVTRMQIAVTPANPDVVYFLGGGEATKCWKSSDNGESFTPQHNGFTNNPLTEQVWYDMAFDVSPINEDELVAGGVRVFRSSNSGTSYTEIQPGNMHVDIHWLKYFGDVLYCGNDGGIYRSYNYGNTWENLSLGLQITQYYDFSNSKIDVSQISAGSQDNGTHLFKNGNWRRYSGGDGLQTEIDYTNPDIIYHSYQNGAMLKTINGGSTHFGIFEDATGESNWETPIQIDPNNPNIVFLGRQQLWKSIDGGISSQPISDFFESPIDVIEIAKADSDVIYFAEGTRMYKTTDGGANWNLTSQNLPQSFFSSIEIHPTDVNKVWVTYSSYSPETNVYYSEDGGSTWTNISGSLPDFPSHQIIYQADHPDNCLYVATEVGVFYRDDTYDDWIPFMTDLPNVYVSDIEIIEGTNIVRIATFGRGVWENQVVKSIDYPASADFLAAASETCPGIPIQFENKSQNYEDIVEWYFEGGIPETSTDEHPIVTFPNDGVYDVRLIVADDNGMDTLLLEDYITVVDYMADLDLSEPFDSGEVPSDWKIISDDNSITWASAPFIGAYGENTGCLTVNNYAYNVDGQKDYIQIPSVDLSQTTQPTLEFDLAYTYYQNGGLVFIDSLAVYYSLDCGQTLTKFWQSGGLELATSDPLASEFFPENDQWKTIVVDLLPLIEHTSIKFYVANIGYYGNNMYIDNINIKAESTLVDLDGDGFNSDEDCDDNNADINPDQEEEPYNGIDDDCNPETLDDDLDQDGFLLEDDCDDNNPDINPNQEEEPYNGIDDDCDAETLDDDLDQDGFLLEDDCDDNNTDINPGQEEEPYNGIDDDCNAETLDDDLDQDGFLLVDDCDDTNPDINPDAEEIPNNDIDEDCDGMDLATSTHEIANSTINIYPNPTVDIVYIDVLGELNYQINLYSLEGKLIISELNSNHILVDAIPQGTYLLEIKDVKTSQKIVEKIIIGN